MNFIQGNIFSVLRQGCSSGSLRRLCQATMVTLALCSGGCAATYNAGSSRSPDGKYVVDGHVRGAYGHAFLDRTAKTIRIQIRTPAGAKLLNKSYRVVGSDVCWDADWDDQDNLTMVIFDYGPGIFWGDARKNGLKREEIRKLTFRCDARNRRFIAATPNKSKED